MGKQIIILLLSLICTPIYIWGQQDEDPILSELLQSVQAQQCRYWFDDAIESIVSSDLLHGVGTIDVSVLSDGIHTLHCQVAGADGALYGISSGVFLKVGFAKYDAVSIADCRLKYWFDEDFGHLQEDNLKSGLYQLDVSALSDGMHTLHYMVTGQTGEVYHIASDVFLKIEEVLNDDVLNNHVKPKSISYWFDNNHETRYSLNNLDAICMLDVSELEDGIHIIHYQVMGEDGLAYGLSSGIFYKNEEVYKQQLPNKIVKYQYWLNNDNGSMQTVEISTASNPYSLLTLLPVQNEPIRSSSFLFEMTDGKPTIYAKNDLHIRFHDNYGYFSDAEKTFVDRNTKTIVENIELLTPNSEQTIVRPAENAIKWYKVEAVKGDSLAFKTDYTCSMQVFSPTGVEVYASSGVESTRYGGCHAAEDGIYYLALHDVTSSTASSIKVNYQHIDKYALLSYTPDEVGVVNNIVSLQLKGNGYDKLKNVYLRLDDKTLTADNIKIYGKANAVAQFVLSGAEIKGQYNIDLEFEDEDVKESIVKESAVTLSEPQWGELTTKISHNGSWQNSVNNTKVMITNTGNVPYHFVPINLAYDHPGVVSSFNLKNFYIPLDNRAEDGDYNPFFYTDNFLGDNTSAVVTNLYIPEIKPYETVELTLDIVSTIGKNFNFYAWTGDPLNSEERMKGTKEDGRIRDSESNIPSLDAYYEVVDDFDETIDYIEGLAERLGISDKVSDALMPVKLAETAANTSINLGRMIGNLINGIRYAQAKQSLELMGLTEDDPEFQEIIGMYPLLESPSVILRLDDNNPLNWFLKLWEKQVEISSRKTPKPIGHSIYVPAPMDPNDIIGYMSESGSNYMPRDLMSTNYTIECENDPTFATGAAHTVVITDTIDGNTHDLTTFAATGVKIGSKYMALNGEKQFTKTMDLRPEVNIIAEVNLAYDEEKGIANWKLSSLDPMTMEPILNPYEGVLPINNDGLGIGEVSFSIGLKQGLTDGDEVSNMASIVFDHEDPIVTPTWVNIVDGVLPESSISEIVLNENSTISVSISASDNRSQPWQYDVYAREQSSNEWTKVAANIPVEEKAIISFKEAGNYKFYSIVKDGAGNIEEKDAIEEFSMYVPAALLPGDVNNDRMVDTQDAIKVIQHYLNKNPEGFKVEQADVTKDGVVDTQDAIQIIKSYLKK